MVECPGAVLDAPATTAAPPLPPACAWRWCQVRRRVSTTAAAAAVAGAVTPALVMTTKAMYYIV